MKAINLFLICCLYPAGQPLAWAQSQSSYKAELLMSDGKKIHAEQVELLLVKDEIKIQGTKKSLTDKTIPFAAIQSIDYTYSERPRYTAGTLSALAFGIAAWPVFFTKTKKNWLTINADKDSAIMQLESNNYRMLLLAIRNQGIKITDSGDRDVLNK